jgi:superfamily II DNA/RNA helicase
LLFSASLNTIGYLYKQISDALPNVRIKVITGAVEKSKREEIRTHFKLNRSDINAIDLLICSEIGSEGLDFQFCDKMINYDIP